MTDKAISYPDDGMHELVAHLDRMVQYPNVHFHYSDDVEAVRCATQLLREAADRSRRDPVLTAEVERLREAHQRIVNLDEAMGHNVTVADAYHAIAISRAALGEA